MNNIRYILLFCLLSASLCLSARCGEVYYGQHTQALDDMHTYVLSVFDVVILICNTLAVLLGLYSATTIYIKVQHGDDGLDKSISMLAGSFLFLLISTIVLPQFFGLQYGGGIGGGSIFSLEGLFGRLF